MAIYHLNVKIIGRSSGRSSVAAAAYRSGDTLTNNYDGLTHDYSRKGWIERTEIMLPDNAPPSYKDRSTLWNAVESAEKSANSQLAREIEIALPHELTLEQQTALIRAYIDKNFVSHGMIADFAIHNPPVTDGYGIPIDTKSWITEQVCKHWLFFYAIWYACCVRLALYERLRQQAIILLLEGMERHGGKISSTHR